MKKWTKFEVYMTIVAVLAEVLCGWLIFTNIRANKKYDNMYNKVCNDIRIIQSERDDIRSRYDELNTYINIKNTRLKTVYISYKAVV